MHLLLPGEISIVYFSALIARNCSIRAVKSMPERPECPLCGSRRIAALKSWEEEEIKIAKSRRRTNQKRTEKEWRGFSRSEPYSLAREDFNYREELCEDEEILGVEEALSKCFLSKNVIFMK